MKQGIHPEYRKVVFMDSTTEFKFISGSTRYSNETITMEDGNEYPLIRVDVSLIRTRSTQVARNSHLRTVVSSASTRSTNVNRQLVCTPPRDCPWRFLFFLDRSQPFFFKKKMGIIGKRLTKERAK